MSLKSGKEQGTKSSAGCTVALWAMKIFMPAVYAPYVEHVPPSDVAAIFWLKNRDLAH